MIVIYGAPPTRALRPLWMMEEMGLSYELRPVHMPTRWQNAELLALNPGGYVPVLIDGDVTLLESIAMLQYLGAKYGPTPLIVEPDEADYALYLQFLHFGEASLGAAVNVLSASRVHAPADQKVNWGGQFSIDLMVRRTVIAERQLAKTPFIAGERFTAADIAVHYSLELAYHLGFDERLSASVRDYVDRMRTRPAYKRAYALGDH